MKDQQTNLNFGEKLSKWLSFKDRINQQDFWLFHVLPFVLLYLLPIPFISLFSIWILLAGLVKSFHDSDVSFKKKLLPFSIVGIVGMVVLAVVHVIIFIVTLMGAMTASISPNDFSDGFENVFRIIIFGIPFLALVIIAIYAGLKPSSLNKNKYRSPTPTRSFISKKNKTRIRRGILIFIVVFLSLLVGFVAIRIAQNRKEPEPLNAELTSAIKDGKNVGKIRALLENGEDPNKLINGTTPLVWVMSHIPILLKLYYC